MQSKELLSVNLLLKTGHFLHSHRKHSLVEMIIYYDIKYENKINKVIFLLQV